MPTTVSWPHLQVPQGSDYSQPACMQNNTVEWADPTLCKSRHIRYQVI